MNGLVGALTSGVRETGYAARTMVLMRKMGVMRMLTPLIRLCGESPSMCPFMRRTLVTPGFILMLMLRIRVA